MSCDEPKTSQNRVSGQRSEDILASALDMNWSEPALNWDYAKKLAESIAAAGLLHPPIVEDLGNGRFKVTVGRHRVFACVEILGWAKIPCTVTTGTDAERAAAWRSPRTFFGSRWETSQTRRLFERWLKQSPRAKGKKPGKGLARDVQLA